LDEPAAAHTVVRLPAAALLDAPPEEQLADSPADEAERSAAAAPSVAPMAATAIASAAVASLTVRNASVADAVPRVYPLVIQRLDTEVAAKLERQELSRQLTELVSEILVEQRIQLNQAEQRHLVTVLLDDMLGLGPLEPLLADDAATDIMVNGAKQVYVERRGKLELTDVIFRDNAHVMSIATRIVTLVGRRIDESTPLVDARLLDGSRVNAVIHPLAIGGPFLTIRKFSADPLTVDDLIGFGSMSPQVAKFLQGCVVGRLNVLISGGTGTGKTTMLNVLSSFIPAEERIVTVEDAKELQLHQDHVLALEARPPNIEGRGEITIRDLVRNTLRMRPDRIVVGECRGGEALDMLQAMNTGHDGSLTTIHSNSPRDSLARLETLTLMSGFELPVRAIREQMASALDLIVHIGRLRDGTRRITHVSEVQGMEGDVITLQDLFLFDFGMGVDTDGRFKGHLKSTGIRPKFAERLADFGIRLSGDLFQSEGFARRAVGTR